MNPKSQSTGNEDFDLIKKDIQRIVKSINGIIYIKPNDPHFHSKLERYGQSLPKGADLEQPIDMVKARIKEYVNNVNNIRLANFPKNFQSYISGLQQKGCNFRIIDNSVIRINAIEIRADHQTGQVSVFFNKSKLLSGREIWSPDDIEAMFKEAEGMLKERSIPEEELPGLVMNSYRTLRIMQEYQKISNANLVPLHLVHGEFILEMVRKQLKGKSGFDKKITEVFLPEWAFLYNIERYRQLLPKLPEEQKVTFVTGSQAQTEKYGMILNGLNPQLDYKKFCFIQGSVR
jgi:hypothetical protein